MIRRIVPLIAMLFVSCSPAANQEPKAPPPVVASSASAPPSSSAKLPPLESADPPPLPAKVVKPIDPAAVAAATDGKPEVLESVVKVSFPRDDVAVEVDNWKMPPFMGLTSWAGFLPAEKAGVEAMVMGDLVLFEDEVNPAMSAALENGVEVTALHNHFFFDKPKVFFMHIGGEGSIETLGKGVKQALAAARAIRKKTPKPSASFGGPQIPAKSKIDPAPLDAIFGLKGATKDGMYKATMGRKASGSCGCTIGKAMGVNTWAAFAGEDGNAVVDGDFAVTENELQSVLKSLRSSGIDVVAIHHHMTGESPRILFLHYWAKGKAIDLAMSIKKALDLTAWDGKAKSA